MKTNLKLKEMTFYAVSEEAVKKNPPKIQKLEFYEMFKHNGIYYFPSMLSYEFEKESILYSYTITDVYNTETSTYAGLKKIEINLQDGTTVVVDDLGKLTDAGQISAPYYKAVYENIMLVLPVNVSNEYVDGLRISYTMGKVIDSSVIDRYKIIGIHLPSNPAEFKAMCLINDITGHYFEDELEFGRVYISEDNKNICMIDNDYEVIKFDSTDEALAFAQLMNI